MVAAYQGSFTVPSISLVLDQSLLFAVSELVNNKYFNQWLEFPTLNSLINQLPVNEPVDFKSLKSLESCCSCPCCLVGNSTAPSLCQIGISLALWIIFDRFPSNESYDFSSVEMLGSEQNVSSTDKPFLLARKQADIV